MGESANICARFIDSEPVTKFGSGDLPCKSRSRMTCCRLAARRPCSDPTNSGVESPDPRLRWPPPPYCLLSLPRSIRRTTHTSPRSTARTAAADWSVATYSGAFHVGTGVHRCGAELGRCRELAFKERSRRLCGNEGESNGVFETHGKHKHVNDN